MLNMIWQYNHPFDSADSMGDCSADLLPNRQLVTYICISSNVTCYLICYVTLGKLSNRDMRHYDFVKSTCDIGNPPSRAPLWGIGSSVSLGWYCEGRVHHDIFPQQGRIFLTLNLQRKSMKTSERYKDFDLYKSYVVMTSNL